MNKYNMKLMKERGGWKNIEYNIYIVLRPTPHIILFILLNIRVYYISIYYVREGRMMIIRSRTDTQKD